MVRFGPEASGSQTELYARDPSSSPSPPERGEGEDGIEP